MTERNAVTSSRPFLGHRARGKKLTDYWSQVFSDLHSAAADWIAASLDLPTDELTWHGTKCAQEIPLDTDCVVLTHGTHCVQRQEVLGALRTLEERGVKGVFLIFDHQPAALRALAGQDGSAASLDSVELLRRTHIETDFSLRKKVSFPARLCRTEVLQLARRGALERGGATADFFHGCRELYQVLEAEPTAMRAARVGAVPPSIPR